MKIVNEIAHLDLGLINGQVDESIAVTIPKFNLFPSNFSGPDHMRQIYGSCFDFHDDQYKFTFCPFSNVTQEELQPIYEPQKIVLGVWGEWLIEKNTFAAMRLLQGNSCASQRKRETIIFLRCGKINQLVDIKEPHKCKYEGIFETPLVCGNNSVVVYPRLPLEFQRLWDRIESERFNKILTTKGYEIELKQIFLDAKYLLTEEEKTRLNMPLSWMAETSDCEKSVAKLNDKIRELQRELEIKDERLKYMIESVVGNSNATKLH